MKPAFALSLSDNGLDLLHYSDGEWYGIGTVTLNNPDFSERLNELRIQAFSLENDLSCTVVIPAEHVRYLTLEVDEPGDDEIELYVESELAKATACDIGELIYDIRKEDSVIHVAAVTKNTITEARNFAGQHGFVPTRFASAAENDSWPGVHGFQFEELLTAPETPINLVPDPTTVSANKSPEPPEENQSTPHSGETKTRVRSEPKQEVRSGQIAHPIAEPADPGAFRSIQPSFEKNRQQTAMMAGLSKKRVIVSVMALAAALVLAIGTWIWRAPDDSAVSTASAPAIKAPDPSLDTLPDPISSEMAQTDESKVPTDVIPDTEALADESFASAAPERPLEPALQSPPELTATDEAILEALKVAPSPVEQVVRDPESQKEFLDVTGLSTTAPIAPTPPPLVNLEDIYLSSIDKVGLSQDPVALPNVQSFETDDPIGQAGLSGVAGNRFELDDRGLVTPTPEGTLNPDGVIVFLGRPSSVPPDTPTRFEESPTASDADNRLAGLRPRGRPESLVEDFEREQLGGRSFDELAVIRPKSRPASVQERKQVDNTPTALAVVRVPRPRVRPSTVAALAARKSSTGSAPLASTAAVAKTQDEADSFQPRTVSPKIPTTASVARQATMDNALNLRRLNLIGVYGTPANRRALVRLPSGRYKKLKVGDRIDGGRVIAIGDSELRYQKGGRNITLKMPRS
ncbi:MAG: hypothetical protein ACWA49_14400 [Ruegeria sp.]